MFCNKDSLQWTGINVYVTTGNKVASMAVLG